MIICFILIIFSLQQIGVFTAGLNDYLEARYKFAGDFKDFTGNYGDATNNGTTWINDKDGKPNGAVNFYLNNYISLPVDIINGL